MRKRIIDAKLRGDSEQKIASEKSICKSTVTKIWSLYKSTGSYFPRSNFRGRKPKFLDAQLEEIRTAILENSDITLQELIDKFSLQISVPGLSKIVRFKLGFRYKKKVYVHQNNSQH
jgi:transposase